MRRDQADSVLLILLRANRTKLRSKTNPTFTPPVPMTVQSRIALRASYRQTGSNRTACNVVPVQPVDATPSNQLIHNCLP